MSGPSRRRAEVGTFRRYVVVLEEPTVRVLVHAPYESVASFLPLHRVLRQEWGIRFEAEVSRRDLGRFLEALGEVPAEVREEHLTG
jgi:hypothetical protein